MIGPRSRLLQFLTLLTLALLVSACADRGGVLPTVAATSAPQLTAPPQPTRAPLPTQIPLPTETPKTTVGTRENPIQMYFVPSVDAAVIVESGEKIAAFLNEQTGLEFQVQVPATYAATIDALGGCNANCMAFIPALGYVIAHDRHGITVAAAGDRGGLTHYYSEFLVARDGDIDTLEDLAGKK
jgi:phosphonate transport system substrate-binding protein